MPPPRPPSTYDILLYRTALTRRGFTWIYLNLAHARLPAALSRDKLQLLQQHAVDKEKVTSRMGARNVLRRAARSRAAARLAARLAALLVARLECPGRRAEPRLAPQRRLDDAVLRA